MAGMKLDDDKIRRRSDFYFQETVLGYKRLDRFTPRDPFGAPKFDRHTPTQLYELWLEQEQVYERAFDRAMATPCGSAERRAALEELRKLRPWP